MPQATRFPITKVSLREATERAKREAKLVRLWDATLPGLGARIQPTGSVSWFLHYAKDDGGGPGAWRTYTLRNTDGLTIDDVRREAEKVRTKLANGVDPLDTRTAERLAPTVAVAFPMWLGDVRNKLKPRTYSEYVRQWEKEIEPALGSLKVKDITPSDVRALHRSITGGTNPRPALANRVRSRLHTFFRWCESEGFRPYGSNPVVHDIERNPEREQERFLQREQQAALFAALDRAGREGLPVAPQLAGKPRGNGGNTKARPSRAVKGIVTDSRRKRGSYNRHVEPTVRIANPNAVAALRFLCFTGWREQEALSLRWDAVDFERGTVHLTDTKTGASSRVLNAVALDILRSQRERQRLNLHPVYVFPGSVQGEPLKEIRHVWYAVRHAAGLDTGTRPVRLHDLRHTFASVLVSSGASLETVGAALGHRDAKSTQRYAKLFPDAVRSAADKAAEAMLATTQQARTHAS